jgi:hypothetical protein
VVEGARGTLFFWPTDYFQNRLLKIRNIINKQGVE